MDLTKKEVLTLILAFGGKLFLGDYHRQRMEEVSTALKTVCGLKASDLFPVSSGELEALLDKLLQVTAEIGDEK